VTPLYPQKLALTSPTGGGRSVGIVRSRTKDTEFTFWYNCYYFTWSDTYFIQLETLLINHPSYFPI